MPNRFRFPLELGLTLIFLSVFTNLCFTIWLVCRVYDRITKEGDMSRDALEEIQRLDQEAMEAPLEAFVKGSHGAGVLGELMVEHRARRTYDPMIYDSPLGAMTAGERAAYIAVEEFRKCNPDVSDDYACRKARVELATYVDAKRKAIATAKEAFECPVSDLIRPEQPIMGGKRKEKWKSTGLGRNALRAYTKVNAYLAKHPGTSILQASRAVGVPDSTYGYAVKKLEMLRQKELEEVKVG
jgi:hypothetical protein